MTSSRSEPDHAPSIEAVFERLRAQLETQRRPPVEQWHPQHGGVLDIRICRDGYWYYQGDRIRRDALVRLFASILRKDPDGYVLVTPAERILIRVDDVPFIAIDFEQHDGELIFRTNVGDLVLLGPEHGLRMGGTDALVPYLHVRGGLEARVTRSMYYRLLDHLVVEDGRGYLESAGERFLLGTV